MTGMAIYYNKQGCVQTHVPKPSFCFVSFCFVLFCSDREITERERERDRQTDRQAGRQTDRQNMIMTKIIYPHLLMSVFLATAKQIFK